MTKIDEINFQYISMALSQKWVVIIEEYRGFQSDLTAILAPFYGGVWTWLGNYLKQIQLNGYL